MSMPIVLPPIASVLLFALGAALVVLSICRLRPMTKPHTLARVRHAAAGKGVAGLLLMLAVTVRPDWLPVAVVACPLAMLGWMLATAHAWRGPLPAEMQAQRWGDTVPDEWREQR